MRHALVLAALAVGTGTAAAQQPGATVRVIVRHDSTPVVAAVARSGGASRITDAEGRALLRVTPGAQLLVVTRLGFSPDTSRFSVAEGADTTVSVALQALAQGTEAVVVSATRAERRVEETPIRVEVIDEEEIGEKSAMTPGDITMMLNETPGLRVQATSPSLGGAGVRVQGLRGRYTLLLSDGLPLTGEAGGLGMLQMPPVDLARVEVIKGTASALYGPAALGGVVNLIARRPEDEPITEVVLNQTSRNGTDAVLFTSRMLPRDGWGGTLLASAHRQSRADVDGDGWADIAGYRRAVLRPRLFFDNHAGQSLLATVGATVEERSGGMMAPRLTPDGTAWDEGLGTVRVDAGVNGRTLTSRGDLLAVRASYTTSRLRRRIYTDLEHDQQQTGFAEFSATMSRGASTWVLGASVQVDDYANRDVAGFGYRYSAPAIFAQGDRDITSWMAVSANGRVDAHSKYGTTFSPRVSLLLHAPRGVLAGWNARFSAGSGAFAPVPLTEDTEVSGLRPLRPLGKLGVERAVGTSADIGGLMQLGGEARLEFGVSAFANRVADALTAVDEATTTPDGARQFSLVNAPVAARTRGVEVLARLVAGDVRLTGSYGITSATEWNAGAPAARDRVESPLVPRTTAGLELYYTGRQRLDDDPYRAESRSYLVIGFLVERVVGRARLFLNAENLLDQRQTRTDPLLRPARGRGGRWTTDVWSLLDGRTMNAGVRVRL